MGVLLRPLRNVDGFGRAAAVIDGGDGQVLAARGAVAAGPDALATVVRPSASTSMRPPSRVQRTAVHVAKVWPMALKIMSASM
jgi:hypothetical protein